MGSLGAATPCGLLESSVATTNFLPGIVGSRGAATTWVAQIWRLLPCLRLPGSSKPFHSR